MKLLDKRHVGETHFLPAPVRTDQQSRPAEGTKWKFNVIIRLSAGGFLDSPSRLNEQARRSNKIPQFYPAKFLDSSCSAASGAHTQVNTKELISLEGFVLATTSSFDLDGTATFAFDD